MPIRFDEPENIRTDTGSPVTIIDCHAPQLPCGLSIPLIQVKRRAADHPGIIECAKMQRRGIQIPIKHRCLARQSLAENSVAEVDDGFQMHTPNALIAMI